MTNSINLIRVGEKSSGFDVDYYKDGFLSIPMIEQVSMGVYCRYLCEYRAFKCMNAPYIDNCTLTII